MQQNYGNDAIIFIIKCLAEDLISRSNDLQITIDMKVRDTTVGLTT